MRETEKEEAEKTQAQILRNAFEGLKGRQPRSDQELNEWLASDEGKQATIFESTSASRWGETAVAPSRAENGSGFPSESNWETEPSSRDGSVT